MHLANCYALCTWLLLKTNCTLQVVQNAVDCMLLGKTRFHHATASLQELHWLPVVLCQIQFKVLVSTYEALYRLGPGYLKNHLPLQISTLTCSHQTGPFFKSNLLRKLCWWEPGRDWAFSVVPPTPGFGTPLSLKFILVLESFKNRTFKISFHPLDFCSIFYI